MNKFNSNQRVMVELNFVGCITETNIDTVPQSSGIYVCFICDKLVNREGNYNCKKIAYIGKAEGTDNLRKRMREHFNNDYSEWAKKCKLSNTETFVYNYAEFNDLRLADVESALIFNNHPIINTQHKDGYNGQSYLLWINCKGDVGLLKTQISVAHFIK